MTGMVRMDGGCVCVSVVKSLNPSLQEHVRGDSISAVTTPSSTGQQSQRAHGQASPDLQLCQSGGGGVKRRRASRASVRAGLNLRVIVPSASSGCLLGTPSFTRTLTRRWHAEHAAPRLACRASLNFLHVFSVLLVPLSHGDPPALLDSCTSSRNNKHTSSTRGETVSVCDWV